MPSSVLLKRDKNLSIIKIELMSEHYSYANYDCYGAAMLPPFGVSLRYPFFDLRTPGLLKLHHKPNKKNNKLVYTRLVLLKK